MMKIKYYVLPMFVFLLLGCDTKNVDLSFEDLKGINYEVNSKREKSDEFIKSSFIHTSKKKFKQGDGTTYNSRIDISLLTFKNNELANDYFKNMGECSFGYVCLKEDKICFVIAEDLSRPVFIELVDKVSEYMRRQELHFSQSIGRILFNEKVCY